MVSVGGGFAEFVEEVRAELVLSFLEFVLGHAVASLDGDLEAVLVAPEQVQVHQIDHARGVVPRPRAQQPRSVHCVRQREVVQQRVEVVVGEAAHLAPQSAHLQLRLVVHLANQLLAQLQFNLELSLLLPEQIRTLLHKRLNS